MKNRKQILILVALVLAVALMAGLYFATRPQTQAGEKTFTVTVVHKDGSTKDFTYTSEEEFVGAVVLAEGLVQGEVGDYGLMVETVDGETAIYEKDNAYWAWYVGEEYAITGIDQTPITEGGVYQLIYTASEG